FMVLRDDVYMLGIDGTVTGNRVSPIRSACAVVVSSQNAQRDWLYYQQQTVSVEGFSGEAFSPYVPHTVRAKETKECTDCDVAQIDNKDFSEKIVTAPVSPFGQKFYVKSKYATAIATPTTLGVDPLRRHDPQNEEQQIHLMYGFLYGTDKYEGLVVLGNNLKEKKDFAG